MILSAAVERAGDVDPAETEVAGRILDGVGSGAEEVLVDAPSHALEEAPAGPPKGVELG
jgi:hypothetical protein